MTSNEDIMKLSRGFLKWLWTPTYDPDHRRYAYHEGYLARDRWQPMRLGEAMFPEPTVDHLANEVWKAYEQGQVHLVQEKLKEGVYLYWAIKTQEQL